MGVVDWGDGGAGLQCRGLRGVCGCWAWWKGYYRMAGAYTEAFAGVNGIPLSGLIFISLCVIHMLRADGERRALQTSGDNALQPSQRIHKRTARWNAVPASSHLDLDKCTQDPALKPNAGIQPRWGASACRTRTFPSKPTRIISCQSN